MRTHQRCIVYGMLPVFLACAAMAAPKGGPAVPDGNTQDPPDGQVYVRPDLAIQFKSNFGCLPDSAVAALTQMIEAQFPAVVDVRPPLCSNGVETIGAWVTKPANADAEKARDRGVAKTLLLKPGETFAISAGPGTIQAVATPVWNKTAKRLNDDMQPDPNGDITLNSFTIGTKPDWQAGQPGHLVTTVGGVKDSTWGDVKFWLTMDQTFNANNEVMAQPPKMTLNYSGPFPVGSGTQDPPASVPVNPGAVVASAFPSQIAIPNLLTVGINYGRVVVDYSGITVAGTYAPIVVPDISIAGKRDFWVPEGQSPVTATYSVSTPSLHSALTYVWSIPNKGTGFPSATILSPKAGTTQIRFEVADVPGSVTADFPISVSVTDKNGRQLKANTTVKFHVTKHAPK